MRLASHTCAALALGLLAACDGAGGKHGWTGYVEAEYANVGAPRPGWLTTLDVREGDRVQPGDPLFELDADMEQLALDQARAQLGEAGARVDDASRGARPAEIAALEAQLKEAQTQLVFANAELARGKPLAETGAISKAALDQLTTSAKAAQARVDAAVEAIRIAKLAAREGVREAALASKSAAAAALGQAEYSLDQRSIASRVAGRVERINHRVGEYVTAGAPVVTVLPDNALKVRFFVPQAALPGLAPGAEVQVFADGLDAPIAAQISYIADEAEFTPPILYNAKSRDRLVFAIEARLPQGANLRPGLPVGIGRPAAPAQKK